MKYMGSKRWMLSNGLGHLIQSELETSKRFVDLFSGSGAVARHASKLARKPVLAYDLQVFCVVLAQSVIGRSDAISSDLVWTEWHSRATLWLKTRGLLALTNEITPPLHKGFTQQYVKSIRMEAGSHLGSVTSAYGGYYYSLPQSLWIDALRNTLPESEPKRSATLAALIQAASQCAASPGHTAQPFKCSRGAKEYLHDAWTRDIVSRTKSALTAISTEHALVTGQAKTADANTAANDLAEGDLVFLDPPYSGVHYSRFYHVLETIAKGECGPVSGEGRYPPPAERPRSSYSVSTEAETALDGLLKTISSKGAKAILTFPQRTCSNGLSGKSIADIADKHFSVKSFIKHSNFSTLGGTKDSKGNGYGRTGRQKTHEVVFTLKPR